MRPGRDDWQTLLDSLAELYVRGAKIDWAGFDRDYPRRKTELPTYPFQRRRYWAASPPTRRRHGRVGRIAKRAACCIRCWAAAWWPPRASRSSSRRLAANRPAMLGDHKIQGAVVMPGAGYLEMALAASAVLHGKPW